MNLDRRIKMTVSVRNDEVSLLHGSSLPLQLHWMLSAFEAQLSASVRWPAGCEFWLGNSDLLKDCFPVFSYLLWLSFLLRWRSSAVCYSGSPLALVVKRTSLFFSCLFLSSGLNISDACISVHRMEMGNP
jgi:hypothetical protein